MYLDEAGIDPRICREYARSPRGIKVLADVSGKRERRTSLIAAWLPHSKQMIAPYAFEGHTDATRFNGWIQTCLVPTLRKGQTVILDNAPFHSSQKTRELIEAAGCKLRFLPTYSPDLNPIEHQWAKLKRSYRSARARGYNHHDAINMAFQ